MYSCMYVCWQAVLIVCMYVCFAETVQTISMSERDRKLWIRELFLSILRRAGALCRVIALEDLHWYTHIHTYIHTYLHTYIQQHTNTIHTKPQDHHKLHSIIHSFTLCLFFVQCRLSYLVIMPLSCSQHSSDFVASFNTARGFATSWV